MLLVTEYWCSGCGQLINKDQERDLGSVGKMCKLCGSGRVVPVDPTPKEKND
jgi:DNA-directed RNA polymerase subunit RPC12/RpoP